MTTIYQRWEREKVPQAAKESPEKVEAGRRIRDAVRPGAVQGKGHGPGSLRRVSPIQLVKAAEQAVNKGGTTIASSLTRRSFFELQEE